MDVTVIMFYCGDGRIFRIQNFIPRIVEDAARKSRQSGIYAVLFESARDPPMFNSQFPGVVAMACRHELLTAAVAGPQPGQVDPVQGPCSKPR